MITFRSKVKNYQQQVKMPNKYLSPLGETTLVAGKVAQFENYELSTADSEIIESLRKSPYLGEYYWEVDENEINDLREKSKVQMVHGVRTPDNSVEKPSESVTQDIPKHRGRPKNPERSDRPLDKILSD